MNIAGVLLLRFIGSLEQSAAAQAAYAIGYTELFSMITWTSVGLMGAAATIAGQNLGAGHPERAMQGVHAASRIGLTVAARRRADVRRHAATAAAASSAPTRATSATIGAAAAALPRRVRASSSRVALVYTGGLQGTGDTRSPLFITLASQIAMPIGLCALIQACGRSKPPTSGSPSCSATSRAACSACCASARASGGTSRWRSSGRGLDEAWHRLICDLSDLQIDLGDLTSWRSVRSSWRSSCRAFRCSPERR